MALYCQYCFLRYMFFAKIFVWQVDSRKKFYSKFFESGQIIANWKFRAVIFASQQLTT